MKKLYFLPLVVILPNVLGFFILFYVWSSMVKLDWMPPSQLQGLVRFQGILAGLLVVVWFLYSFARSSLSFRYTYEKILAWFLVLDIAVFCVGLMNGNDFIYLLGDTYKLVIVPLICLTGLMIYNRDLPLEKIIKAIFYIILGVFFVEFSFQIAAIILRHHPIIFSVDSFMVPLTLLLLKTYKKWWYWPLIITCLASAILSLKRTNWVIVLVIVGLAFFIDLGLRKSIWLFVVRGLKLMSVIIFLVIITFWPLRSMYLTAWSSVSYRLHSTGLQDSSSVARFAEADAAIRHMQAQNHWSVWLFGMGNGAKWNYKFYKGITDEKYRPLVSDYTTHEIHNTFGVFIFRTGFIGLLLYLWFMANILWQIWQKLRHGSTDVNYNIYLKVLFVFLILRFVTGSSAFIFWGDFMMGVAVVLTSYLLRQDKLCH